MCSYYYSLNIYQRYLNSLLNFFNMTKEIWIIILCIILLSSIVKGTTGFGFALFSFPILAHFLPVRSVVPLITFINLFTSVIIILQMHKPTLKKKSIFVLCITGSLGVIIGTIALKHLPEFTLKLFASIILIIISIFFLTGYRFNIRKIKRGSIIAGLTSGFLGGSLSISGPPLALFLTSIKIDANNFRHTFAWFNIITASIALIDYLKIGIINRNTLCIFLLSIPILLVGVRLGKFLNQVLPVAIFYKVVVLVTLLSGILLAYTTIQKIDIHAMLSNLNLHQHF